MPGKKSLKKQEKQQERKDKETVKNKEKKDKIIGSIDVPDMKGEEVMDSLTKMKAITPSGVASQFNLKVSVAKRMLNNLEREGIIKLAASSQNVKVYTVPGD